MASSGLGDWPLRSTWARSSRYVGVRQRHPEQARTSIFHADADQAVKLAVVDWFFGVDVPPPASTIVEEAYFDL